MIEPPVALPPAVLPIERASAALEVILCSGFPTQILIITLLSLFGMTGAQAHAELTGFALEVGGASRELRRHACRRAAEADPDR